MSVPVVKREYVEQNDSSNDGESDDENGIDGIFDFVNDSGKKKLMKKFKKKKALVEENSRKELDEMIVIHKRLASDLDQKHNQEILELRNKHEEANMKMRKKHDKEKEALVEKKMVKLERITKQEEEAVKKFFTFLKGAKRKYDEDEEEKEKKEKKKKKEMEKKEEKEKETEKGKEREREKVTEKEKKKDSIFECEVRISLSEDIIRDMVEPGVAGVYKAVYSLGRRVVFRHSEGVLTLRVLGGCWAVTSGDCWGPFYLWSGSVPSMCPADPRAARRQRTHWIYWRKTGDGDWTESGDGDIRVTCNKHKQ